MATTRTDRLRSVGNLQQLGGTRLVTIEDGSERGVRAVEFRTTYGLEFGVLVDRAMDVAWCRLGGKSIAWHSPTGWIAPWYREPEGLGFLRTFQGGLFVTCGLDHILFPDNDPLDTYNYPFRETATYGLHGRASTIPAVLRSYGEQWDGDDCRLHAEGEVRQAGTLAETLVLRRRVETLLDGRTIWWTDEVTNEGHYPAPHMFLYHMNLGAPLLDASCELLAPITDVRWASPTATGSSDEHLLFHGPQQGFVEQAYSHALAPGPDGRVSVALINNADVEPWGVVLRYQADRFPYFFQWRYLDAGTYALGFEPSTNGIAGRADARKNGELVILEPGETRTYRTELEVLIGSAECDEVRREVEATLQGVGG